LQRIKKIIWFCIMKRKWIVLLCMAWLCAPVVSAAGLWVEAERFAGKGGWVVDQQFMDVMGSPYLMAHGMGEPVADASTRVVFPETGVYYVYARTYNWTAPWQQAAGPG
jgi:hypothetical protein